MASPRGKNFEPPMTLANMRQNGVHAVIARCEACGHVADVNVDALAGTITVPEVGRRLRRQTSAAGSVPSTTSSQHCVRLLAQASGSKRFG